jgi:signal transduction histidine kinase
MRIRHKILAGYLALIAVAVVLVFFFLVTLSDINRRYADLINRDQSILLQANNLRSGIQRQIVAARTYEINPDLSLLIEYNDAIRQQQEAINNITPLLMVDDDRDTIESIENASSTYTQLADETIELVGQGRDTSTSIDRDPWEGTNEEQYQAELSRKRLQGETARYALINTTESFIVKKNQKVSEAQAALAARVEEISTQLLLWSLVGVIGSLIGVTLLTEGFTSPLRRLMRNIQGIAQGDLKTAIAVRSRDEIGELAGVLEVMRKRLSAAAAENEALLGSAREEAEKLATTQGKLEKANLELQDALKTESEARKRIEEVDRLKSEFASMITHELKTPVSYVYNYAGALKEHSQNLNEGQRSEFLTAIQGEAQHMLTLIDDILAISLLDAGGLSHRFVETDLRKLTDAVVKDHQLTTRRHTISIKGPDSLSVRADPTRLKQVLNNLLSNAIKYSPQGGTIEVRLRTNPVDDTAIIYVRDNGIGIAAEDVPRMFERFSRIQRKETVAIPGSGLGLYIANHIVEAHGGTLKLQPAPGKGTIAEVTVPLIVEGMQDELEDTEDGRTRKRRGRSGNGRRVYGNGNGTGDTGEHLVVSENGNGNGSANGHVALTTKQTDGTASGALPENEPEEANTAGDTATEKEEVAL